MPPTCRDIKDLFLRFFLLLTGLKLINNHKNNNLFFRVIAVSKYGQTAQSCLVTRRLGPVTGR